MTLRMTLPGLIRPASAAGDSKHDGDGIASAGSQSKNSRLVGTIRMRIASKATTKYGINARMESFE